MAKKKCRICVTKTESTLIHTITKPFSDNIYICDNCIKTKLIPYIKTMSKNTVPQFKFTSEWGASRDKKSLGYDSDENASTIVNKQDSQDQTTDASDMELIKYSSKTDDESPQEFKAQLTDNNTTDFSEQEASTQFKESKGKEKEDTNLVEHKLFLACMKGHMTVLTSPQAFKKSFFDYIGSGINNYFAIVQCKKEEKSSSIDKLHIHPSVVRDGEMHSAAKAICNADVALLVKGGHVHCFASDTIMSNITANQGLSTVQYKTHSNDRENIILPYLKPGCMY